MEYNSTQGALKRIVKLFLCIIQLLCFTLLLIQCNNDFFLVFFFFHVGYSTVEFASGFYSAEMRYMLLFDYARTSAVRLAICQTKFTTVLAQAFKLPKKWNTNCVPKKTFALLSPKSTRGANVDVKTLQFQCTAF